MPNGWKPAGQRQPGYFELLQARLWTTMPSLPTMLNAVEKRLSQPMETV